MKMMTLCRPDRPEPAARSGPTINCPTTNGQSDATQLFPGEPHVVTPTGPYGNTVNSLGGRFAGTYGGN